MDFHELFNSETLERRHDCFKLLLHENSIEAILVAYCLEDVKLDQSQSMPLAILKLLKELRLRLVVQVGVLQMLSVLQPDGRVHDL